MALFWFQTFSAPDNHRNAIGAEHDLVAGVEVVDGFNESDTADLKEVVRVFSAACKTLNDAENETQIALNQLFSCSFVSVSAALQKLLHLVVLQCLEFCGVHTADLYLALRISIHTVYRPVSVYR